MRARAALLLLLGLLAALAAGPRGRALELDLELLDEAGAPLSTLLPGASVRLRLEARDPLSGWPPAAPPRAWLATRRGPEEACPLLAARLVQRGADPFRERALDGYRILLFGPEGELAILDPRFRLASARLQTALRLPATPTAAVLDPRRALLWAALPGSGLVRVELAGAGRIDRLETVEAIAALALLADGRLALAEARGRLAILDPSGRETTALALPGPLQALAADPATGRLWAAGVAGLDLLEPPPEGGFLLERVLDEPLHALLLLPNKRLLLARGEDGLVSLDADEALPLARTPLPAPLDALLADEEERLLLALDRARGIATLFDATTGRPIGALAPEEGIEEIGLSAAQAYLAPPGSGRIALLPLAGVEPGRLPPLALLVAGSAPRGPAGRLPRLAPTPDRRAMLVLAPGERRVFLHGGGAMLAPSSALPVPFPDARGLLVQPLGPVAVGPGRFELATSVPPSARELVLVFTDPPEAHCLPLPVAAPEAAVAEAAPPRLRLLPPEGPLRAGGPARFALEIEAAGEAAVDPEYLALSTASGWFARGTARPTGAGRFAIELAFPAAGSFELLVRVPALGLDFARSPGLSVEVEAP